MKKEKKKYEKPSVFVVPNMIDSPLLVISAPHPNYDENNERWSDVGSNAKEASFMEEAQSWGEFSFED